MNDSTAKAIGTVGIWASIAVIFTFGIFQFNWNGDGAVFVMILTILLLCLAATISTACIWVGFRQLFSSVRGSPPLPAAQVPAAPAQSNAGQ